MGGTLPGPSRKRRVVVAVLGAFLLVLGWSQWQLWQPFKGGGSGDVVVEIPQGASASEVATKLATPAWSIRRRCSACGR